MNSQAYSYDTTMQLEQIKVICKDCYFEMKKFNLHQL